MGAGVVREIKITSPKNPNKWGKTLAPWFTEKWFTGKQKGKWRGLGDLMVGTIFVVL